MISTRKLSEEFVTFGLIFSIETNNDACFVAFLATQHITVTNYPDNTFTITAPKLFIQNNVELGVEYKKYSQQAGVSADEKNIEPTLTVHNAPGASLDFLGVLFTSETSNDTIFSDFLRQKGLIMNNRPDGSFDMIARYTLVMSNPNLRVEYEAFSARPETISFK